MRALAYMAAAGLVCTLMLWLRLGQPIYTDDITYLMISTRFLFEDGKYWWFFPQCIDSISFDIPLVWKPFAVIRSLAARHLLHFVSGLDWFVVLRATLLVVAGIALLFRLQGDRTAKLNVTSVAAIGLFFIGTVPLFLVHGRPESTILLLLIISFLLFLLTETGTSRWTAALPFILVLFFLWGISLHPQITAFLPFYLLLIGCVPKRMPLIKTVAVSCLLLIVAASVPAWGKLYVCPAVPRVEDFFRQWSVRPRDLLGSVDAWLQVLKLLSDLQWVPDFLSFREEYRLELLVNHRPVSSIYMQLVNLSSIIVELLLVFIIFFFALTLPFYRGLDSFERRRLWAAISLLCSFGIWSAVRGKNPYTIPLIHGTLLLAFATVAPLYQRHGRVRLLKGPLLTFFSLMVILSACGSVAISAYSFGGFGRGYGPIVEAREVYNYAFPRTPEMLHPEKQRDFLERCGFFEFGDDARIAIDETTFFLLPEQPNLMLMMYVGKPFWIRFQDPLSSLMSLKTDAYLLPCEDFPSLLQLPHLREGKLCCGRFDQFEGGAEFSPFSGISSGTPPLGRPST